MTIMFFTALFAILLLANQHTHLDEKLGKDSFVSKILNKISTRNTAKEKPEFTLPFGPRRQNILLLGVDSNGADSDLWVGTRTDTIILLNIDPRTKTVNAISIPRDSKVYLPKGMGVQKVNAAHAMGGVEMTIKTIENTLGIHVDKYIMVHDDAVRAIVDAIGGVDIFVPEHVNVKIESFSIFGGASDERKRKYDAEKITVYIRATALFGGVDVK